MGTDAAERDSYAPQDLVVETATGLVRGDHKRGAYRYKGIPYAAPPVGAGRFAPPSHAASWTGERDATGRFPVAPQPLGGVEALLGATDGPPQSEADCLTLNVWTPAPDGARRPVMVWIHGGAFVTGTGLMPWYDGTNLAARDVVVVTLNYRLGALGFLHLADLGGDRYAGSGTVGLLDQAMALGWVRDNIEAFGGDPDNVTIFGESAGAMSVGTQLALPASQGLFHRAIAQSGSVAHTSDRDRATSVAVRLLDLLGLDRRSVDRLRHLPIEAILEAQTKVSAETRIADGLAFQPTVDGDTLPVAPHEAIRAGAAAGITLLTGTNRDEMRLFTAMDPRLQSFDEDTLVHRARGLVAHDPEGLVQAYRDAMPEATPKELYDAAATDAVFRMPAIALAEAQSDHAPAWLYEFHRESTAFGGALGSPHAVEIPYVFDNLTAPGAHFFTGDVTAEMQDLATRLADAWTTFARTGDPNSGALPAWSRYTPGARTTMILDLTSAPVDDPARPLRQAWHARR